MIRSLILAFMLACVPAIAHAIDPIVFETPEEEARFQTLAKQLRCLVCQNESLADSNAGLAQDLRKEVIELMRTGKSDADIKVHLTDRYGDFVLYKPPMRPGTWLLWWGPAALLLLGCIAAFFVVRKRKPAGATPDTQDPVGGEW